MTHTIAQSNTIPMEHERRFHIANLASLPFNPYRYPHSVIWQGYLEDDFGTRIRSELCGEILTFTKTVKIGEGTSRIEHEEKITEDEFEGAQKKAMYCLTKERYFVPIEGVTYEVNVFTGNLEGYLQIEVEFSSAEAAIAFNPPDWFGTEVTHDPRHGNYHLAKDGIPR